MSRGSGGRRCLAAVLLAAGGAGCGPDAPTIDPKAPAGAPKLEPKTPGGAGPAKPPGPGVTPEPPRR